MRAWGLISHRAQSTTKERVFGPFKFVIIIMLSIVRRRKLSASDESRDWKQTKSPDGRVHYRALKSFVVTNRELLSRNFHNSHEKLLCNPTRRWIFAFNSFQRQLSRFTRFYFIFFSSQRRISLCPIGFSLLDLSAFNPMRRLLRIIHLECRKLFFRDSATLRELRKIWIRWGTSEFYFFSRIFHRDRTLA